METVENSEEFVSCFGPRRPLAPVAYTDGSAHASENTSRFTGRAVGWFGPWAEHDMGRNIRHTGSRACSRIYKAKNTQDQDQPVTKTWNG
ncbi:hypothetical protein LSAT2_029140 [Lamellibrachia satsuma]|nr:hypothetical protein LSAT2_029140 [Lamellibrachia satsuma]